MPGLKTCDRGTALVDLAVLGMLHSRRLLGKSVDDFYHKPFAKSRKSVDPLFTGEVNLAWIKTCGSPDVGYRREYGRKRVPAPSCYEGALAAGAITSVTVSFQPSTSAKAPKKGNSNSPAARRRKLDGRSRVVLTRCSKTLIALCMAS